MHRYDIEDCLYLVNWLRKDRYARETAGAVASPVTDQVRAVNELSRTVGYP